MWSTDTIKKFATIDPTTATESKMVSTLVTVTANSKRSEIGAALIAHFMERRGFTFAEAAERTGESESTLKRHAARATVIMEIDETHALVVWDQLGGVKDSEVRALGETLAVKPEIERLPKFLEWAATKVVEGRCPTWDSEDKAGAIAYIVQRGMAVKDAMRRSLLGYADEYGLTLPEVKRTPQPEEGETTPTAARVATAAALFQKDREQGSEGTEFALSDAEAADLVRAVETSIRTLRMAGRVEDLDVIAGFLAESVALLDA